MTQLNAKMAAISGWLLTRQLKLEEETLRHNLFCDGKSPEMLIYIGLHCKFSKRTRAGFLESRLKKCGIFSCNNRTLRLERIIWYENNEMAHRLLVSMKEIFLYNNVDSVVSSTISVLLFSVIFRATGLVELRKLICS